MRKREIDGKQVELQEIEPLSTDEKWNMYQMPNGDLLKIKLVVKNFFYSSEAKTKDGKPIYEFEFGTVVSVSPANG